MDNGQKTIRGTGPAGYRGNDGQHYDNSRASSDNGQRSRRTPGAEVGQENGPEANMRVRPPARNADISTETDEEWRRK